ncbi:MAG: hypothetical protein E6167_01485 [Varibaculum cambriense]|nr:hypothetical protein [Varibaculum cambriense]MDU5307530.1 hypothetical protein [Varibaculum cambriense]MDU5316185.1 hypothetical protein [Varibaculum cambriense]
MVLIDGADGFSVRIYRKGAVIAQHEVTVFGYLVWKIELSARAGEETYSTN